MKFSSRHAFAVGEYKYHLKRFFLPEDDEWDKWIVKEAFYHFFSKVYSKFIIIIVRRKYFI